MDEGLMTIKQAAKCLNVSEASLRKWEKDGKLTPMKTPGGHRRYNIDQLTDFLEKPNEYNYGRLIEHLCNAQYIADRIGAPHAAEIMEIREDIERMYLKNQGIE